MSVEFDVFKLSKAPNTCTNNAHGVRFIIVSEHVLVIIIDVCSLTPQNHAWNSQSTDSWTH